MMEKVYLKCRNARTFSIHRLHWLVTHRLLQVALGEELRVDQLGALLHVHPVLEEFVNFDIDERLLVMKCPHFREGDRPCLNTTPILMFLQVKMVKLGLSKSSRYLDRPLHKIL